MSKLDFYKGLPLTDLEKEILVDNSYFDPSKFLVDKLKHIASTDVSDNNLLYFRKHFKALIKLYELYLIPLAQSLIADIDRQLITRGKEELIPRCNNCNSDDFILYTEDYDDDDVRIACKNCHADLTDIVRYGDITYEPDDSE